VAAEVEALKLVAHKIQAILAVQAVAQQTIQLVVLAHQVKVMQVVMVGLTQLIHLAVVEVVLALLVETHLAIQVAWAVMALHHLFQVRL
jgi:hypothetical protein